MTIEELEKVPYLEYFKKEKEMLNDFGRTNGRCADVECSKCPFTLNNIDCNYTEEEHVLKRLEIVMNYRKKVDWSKVPKDTPIRVWMNGENDKLNRHFSHYEGGKIYTYIDGTTSFTAYDAIPWDNAELVESED